MMLDKQLMFSEAQAITATADSTNVVDLGPLTGGLGTNTTRNIGTGENLFIFLVVTTAFTDSGSDSTVTVTLTTDDNSSLSSDTTVATLVTLSALTAAGTTHFFKMPVYNYERYIALVYTVANGNLTTGAITAGIVKDPQLDRHYASGFTIS